MRTEQAIDPLEAARFARLRARVTAFMLATGVVVGLLGALTDPVDGAGRVVPQVLSGAAIAAAAGLVLWRYGERLGEAWFAAVYAFEVILVVAAGVVIDTVSRGMCVEILLLGATVTGALFLGSAWLLASVTALACVGAVVLVVSGREPLMTPQAIVSVSTIITLTLVVRLLRTSAVAALLEARQRGLTDHLTGLYNRHGLEEHGVSLWRATARHGRFVAVVLVDIDHFKAVNDTFGHVAGDSLLRHVAQGLSQLVGEDGLLVRLGGEEFLLVAAVTPGSAHVLAEQARLAVRHTWSEPVTVSVGVVEVRPGEADPQPEVLWHAVEAADAALYEAKRAGRDRVRVAGAAVPRPPAPGGEPIVDEITASEIDEIGKIGEIGEIGEIGGARHVDVREVDLRDVGRTAPAERRRRRGRHRMDGPDATSPS